MNQIVAITSETTSAQTEQEDHFGDVAALLARIQRILDRIMIAALQK